MSCAKCAEYHASLPNDVQRRWTCHPCKDEVTAICESGRYCETAKDSITGECPRFGGCMRHEECGDNEYCYSCAKCQQYIADTGRQDDLWECQPCPTVVGGFCGQIAWCAEKQDSIAGECPQHDGCSSHSDCWDGHYCESCSGCQEFQDSLPSGQAARWSCHPCPTTGGGFCERLRFCPVANDGIDGTCPQERGCGSNIECLPTQYCSDCSKCEEHRKTLPSPEQERWTCDPCPTQHGGSCHAAQFCEVANDQISPPCQAFHGCGSHEECGDSEFCLSYSTCLVELGN